MKKYIFLLAASLMATLTYAQSNKEEIDLMQASLGMDKKAAVAEFVTPSPSQKDAFWKLYDEYETQRKELGKQRITLLEEYASKYKTMTSEQADAWTKKVMDLQKKTDGLITTYYGKVRAATDGIVALQFYQMENYILSAIRAQILDQVPFVEKH
jgi:hypothetical protein